MFVGCDKFIENVFFSCHRKREMCLCFMAICLILLPLHKAIAQHTNPTAIKVFFTKLETDVNQLNSSANPEQEINSIISKYFPPLVEDDFNAKAPKTTASAKTINAKEYLEKVSDFGCKVSYQPNTSEITFLKDKQNKPFIRVSVKCSYDCTGMSVPVTTKIFELAVNENGAVSKIMASVFYNDSPRLTEGKTVPNLPKPIPPVVVVKPPAPPSPVSSIPSPVPCPPCPRTIPDLCSSLPILGITRQRRESCKNALLRHLNEFQGRIDCASLGVSPLSGETCSNAIIRHFTEQANCSRMAALQIQKQDNETCAAAIGRHVTELRKRADCDKLLSLGITPKPGENCEEMLKRYLEDGKNLSLNFRVKQNSSTGTVPFSEVAADRYAKKLNIPMSPMPSTQKIEALDTMIIKNLIAIMSDEIADYERRIEAARAANVEVYFIVNETKKTKEGEKKERISLSKAGLTKKELRKFKSPRVKNIYVKLPLQKELFPTNTQIVFKIMVETKVIPETLNSESKPKPLDDFYGTVSEGDGFRFPKTRIDEEGAKVYVVTYYANSNLIRNSNSQTPDEEKRKAYEFYVNSHSISND